MKNRNLILITFSILLAISCGGRDSQKKSYSRFQTFISSLEKVKLPLHYDLISQDIENCSKARPTDTPYIEAQDYILGLHPDTLDNFKVLYLSTGDDFYPKVKIFNKNGKLLSVNLICLPECAAGDPGVDSWSSSVDIYYDSIFARLIYLPFTLDSFSNKTYDYLDEERRGKTFKFNRVGTLDIRERWVRK